MIKKLRRKFILVNMALVLVVLVVVFAILYTTTAQRAQQQTQGALLGALRDKRPLLQIGGEAPPDKRFSTTPVFTVALLPQGNTLLWSSEGVEVSDATLQQAVQEALATGQSAGVLPALHLRFLQENNTLAFADLREETATLTNLVVLSLCVGAGSLLAFFFISLFLSGWALRPVERAWQRQRQFVADASHELKTPLTVILANTDILLAHKEDTVRQQLKWVQYIQAEGVRMKGLVEDMLFLAKADAAQAPPVMQPFDLSDAVWSCLLPFESVAFEQGVALAGNIAPDIQAVGDAGQFKQMVAILLDNACKYAGAGGRVEVTLSRLGDKAQLAVHNTGETIPPEQQSHLFERFYRADESRAREQGGYGLGLAIAQAIVHSAGGRISVCSTPQTGTTFTVLLPLR